MVDKMQNHRRQRRPITYVPNRVISWIYLSTLFCNIKSHHATSITIINNQYTHDTIFVGSVMATTTQQHIFGRINRIITTTTSKKTLHPIDVWRGGGDRSNDDDTANDDDDDIDIDRDGVQQPVHVDSGESMSNSIDAEMETKLSPPKNNETIPDIVTGSKQNNDDTTNYDDDADHTNSKDDTQVDSDHDNAPIEGSESVGVMSTVKKSNAVGDPDGDDDDDDDDDNGEEEDDEEEIYVFDEEEEALSSSTTTNASISSTSTDDDVDLTDLFSIDEKDEDAVVERVQVEVEYTIEEEDDDDREDDEDDVVNLRTDTNQGGAASSSRSGNNNNQRSLKNLGGVGVRSFGQRFKNRNRNNNNDNYHSVKSEMEEGISSSTSKMEQQFLEAWQSYIFYPPPRPPASTTISNNNNNNSSSFWQYLQQHHPSIDTDGKLRLDRRTLYAGLLAEFSTMSTVYSTANNNNNNNNNNNKQRSNRRKFLDTETSQALQAAVSLATQPIWRKSLQRPNAIRLYEIRNNENDPKYMIRESASTTLAMQETITLGLVCTILYQFF